MGAASQAAREKLKAPARTSLRSVREALDLAEGELRWCQEVVAALSNALITEEFGKNVISFQLRLYDAIFRMERVYRQIKQEEKWLISRKLDLNLQWFNQRMTKLASYTKSMAGGLAIARALGDGFAWFFYERNPELITEHLKLQKQNLLPPNLGAVGERLTLENMQGMDGKLLIYHGTTTFLRLGDVSLVDLNTLRISCVGELKTARIDDERVTVSMSFIAGDRNQLPKIRTSSPPDEGRSATPAMPAAMQDRFKRQLKTMQEAIARSKKEGEGAALSHEGMFHYSDLEEVVTSAPHGQARFVQAGPGLILGAYRLPKGVSLGKSLTGGKISGLEKAIDEAPHWAVKTGIPGDSGNSIIIGSVGGADRLTVRSGSLPLMAWPVDRFVLSDILFEKVVVFTFFNPVHILREIREMGFEIELGEKGILKTAKKRVGDKMMMFENYQHFLRMVPDHLTTEREVINFIKRSTDLTEEKFDGSSMRMEFKTRIVRSPRAARKLT